MKISRAGVWAQLAMVVATILIAALLGPKPESAQEAFRILNNNTLTGMLRIDSYNIIMVGLYLFTMPGLIILLLKNNSSLTMLCGLFIFAGVILVLSSHSGFSLLHLSKLYSAALDESVKALLISAGEGVISRDLWHSSSGYFAGIFLQGGGIMISLAMGRSGIFRMVTILSGIGANALDLFQHLIHPFAPGVSEVFIKLMGPFYLVWFISLALDLGRIIKDSTKSQTA